MAIGSAIGLPGYAVGGGGNVASGAPTFSPAPDTTTRTGDAEDQKYWNLERLKRAYADYLWTKRPEITEQQEARRYRHGAQWTAEQIRVLNVRKQPVVTFNRIGRKVDGIVGVTDDLRADPKAYPRSPRFQAGADLATAALRSVLQRQNWEFKAPAAAERAAVDGIGGLELILDRDNKQAYHIAFEPVDVDGFFYDPRSKKIDFSDANYMGVGKWMDVDTLSSAMPEVASKIRDSLGYALDMSSTSDFDMNTWFMQSGNLKTVRLVHMYYQYRGKWNWALFTGRFILSEGESPWLDADEKPICGFLMFSAAVDQDGDRYGFPRNLKSAQDEINQRRSKGLHELNTRRLVIEKGAFDDIEKARQEAVRPDGVVERNKGYDAQFDDDKKQQDIAGQLKFLEDARSEIENFGPNPALLGDQGIANRSGVALKRMQQSGLAELGPFVISLIAWKQKVYETIFCAVKKYYTNERWLRLTDDDGILQFVQINALQNNPMTGMPQIVNAIGELDVDIVLDQGPDAITMMDEMFTTLSQIVPAIAQMLTPPQVQAVVAMLIDASPLPSQAKRQFQAATLQSQQPDPIAEQAKQLKLQGAQAEVTQLQSSAQLNQARALEAFSKAHAAQAPGAPAAPPKFELPPMVQVGQALAGINKSNADAFHKRALGMAEHQSTATLPIDYAQRTVEAIHNRAYDRADLMMRAFEAMAARKPDNPLSAGG